MRVGFLHWGHPSELDGSVRSWRNREWLAGRHEVVYVPIAQASEEADSSEAADLLPDPRTRTPLVVPGVGPGFARVAPWLPVRGDQRCWLHLQEIAAEVDWLWLAWWPLAAWGGELTRLPGGPIVTWDWDALAPSSMSAVRATWRTRPKRATARAIRTIADTYFERRFLPSIDVITAPSRRDAAHFTRVPGVRARLVRNCVSSAAFASVRAISSEQAEPRVVFVGSDYEPNIDGLGWFLASVWPSVRARVRGACLSIVGRGLDSHFESDAARGIEVVGEVADIKPFLERSRIVVSPVFYGAGIPNKVLEGAAAGRPVVTSRHCGGAIGPSEGIRVCGPASDWVDATVELLQHPRLAAEVGEAAAKWLARSYDVQQWEQDMESIERFVLSKQPTKRR